MCRYWSSKTQISVLALAKVTNVQCIKLLSLVEQKQATHGYISEVYRVQL